jgi:hypothetical protein
MTPALASELRFRAEPVPAADKPYGSMLHYRVVALDGAGDAFLTLALRSTYEQAQELVDRAHACPGCAKWLMGRFPSHDGSPMCESPRPHCDCRVCF